MAPGSIEGLLAGREMTERACRILESPTAENLEACRILLETAVGKVQCLKLASPDSGARAEVLRLRNVVRRAAALLQNAAEYHTGWTRLLGVRSGGYERSGEPAGIARRPSVSLEG